MIEVVTYKDDYFLDVVRLVKEFHAEAVSEYDEIFSTDTLIETIKQQKDRNADTCFLLIIDGVCQGILFGVITFSPLNGKPVFQEVIWYVQKEHRFHGVRLLRFAEKMLKDKGCGLIIMAVLENSKTEKLHQFYERLGYRKMETHYVRNL